MINGVKIKGIILFGQDTKYALFLFLQNIIITPEKILYLGLKVFCSFSLESTRWKLKVAEFVLQNVHVCCHHPKVELSKKRKKTQNLLKV